MEWVFAHSFIMDYAIEVSMSKISSRAEQIARPIVEENGCRLWDVEYVREAGSWYLRVYIDKDEGVSINDCEAISKAIDPVLDQEDFIPDSYIFEVCSAGADRVLKRASDFETFMGHQVDISLYKPLNGAKSYSGLLTGRSASNTSIETDGGAVVFENDTIAQVRLHVDF